MTKFFFSYAHADVADEENRDVLRKALGTVETAARTALGIADASIRLDRDILNWGDEWEPALFNEIKDCSLYIALVSPLWLTSDFCRKEYEAFKAHEETRGLGKRLILPISFYDTGLAQLNDQETKNLSDLRKRQFIDWTPILDLTADDRGKLCRSVGIKLAERFREVEDAARDASSKSDTQEPPEPPSEEETNPAPIHRRWVSPASGHYVAGQGQQVLLSVSFSGGWTEDFGDSSISFRIKRALIKTTISNGRVNEFNKRFDGSGWDGGDIAVVKIVGSPRQEFTLQLDAKTDAGIYARPLVDDNDDEPHVYLCGIDLPPGEECDITGTIVILLEPEDIIEPDFGAEPESKRSAREKAKKLLAQFRAEKPDSVVFDLESDRLSSDDGEAP